jgi:hypothetical protein
MTMWTTWHSPGWLLVIAVIIGWQTLKWRLDAGVQPVEMFGSPVHNQAKIYRHFLIARAVNRLAWLMVVVAILNIALR